MTEASPRRNERDVGSFLSTGGIIVEVGLAVVLCRPIVLEESERAGEP